jgi:hypothetical protein
VDEPGMIDTYLDELMAALRVEPRRARRILIETEDHLREAVRDHVAAGMEEAAAERLAIERFGSPREIAARFNGASVTPRGWLLRMYFCLAMLFGVGMVAVGVAGEIAIGAGFVFGKEYIAGNAPDTTYTPARCEELARLTGYRKPPPTTQEDPAGDVFTVFDSANCNDLAIQHHFDEVWRNADVALAFGAIFLGVHWMLRRKFAAEDGSARLPRRAFATLGMAGFGAAAPLLALFGAASLLASREGSGLAYLIDGLVAFPLFLAFLRPGLNAVTAMAREAP